MRGFGAEEDARVLRLVRRLQRERQPGPGPQDLSLSRDEARRGGGLLVRQREHLRQDPGQRPREGRVPRPADLPPRQPVDHGAPDHDRRVQAGERGADHGRHPVLQLRPLGQEGSAPGPDHRPPGGRHDHRGRGRPGSVDGPPPGPDPGLLQHPGRRAHGRPPPLQLLPPEEDRGPRGRDGPRVCEAGAEVRRAAGRAPCDHREAARRQPGPGRGDERHRRGPRPAGDHRRRRDRHGRNALRGGPRAPGRGGRGDLRLRDARRAVRPRDRPDRRVRPARGGPDGLHPPAAREAPAGDHHPLRRAAHRRGDPAHPSRRVGRSALLLGGDAHPGDDPLGGRRGAPDRCPHRRPPGAGPRGAGRRPAPG